VCGATDRIGTGWVERIDIGEACEAEVLRKQNNSETLQIRVWG
jgi:hypothetical protein